MLSKSALNYNYFRTFIKLLVQVVISYFCVNILLFGYNYEETIIGVSALINTTNVSQG